MNLSEPAGNRSKGEFHVLCRTTYEDRSSPTFGLVWAMLFTLCAAILVHGTWRTLSIRRARLQGLLGARKKDDMIAFGLFCMACATLCSAADATVHAFFFGACTFPEATGLNDAAARLRSACEIVARGGGYGALIVGKLVLIVAWKDALAKLQGFQIGGFKKRQQTKVCACLAWTSSPRANALIWGYIFVIVALGILFYSDGEGNPDEKSLRVIIVASVGALTTSLYLLGIAIFGWRWGRKMSTVVRKASDANIVSRPVCKRTTQSIRSHVKSMTQGAVGFLLSTMVSGAGQGARNGWVTQAALCIVFMAVLAVARSMANTGRLQEETEEKQKVNSISFSSASDSVELRSLSSVRHVSKDSAGSSGESSRRISNNF